MLAWRARVKQLAAGGLELLQQCEFAGAAEAFEAAAAMAAAGALDEPELEPLRRKARGS